MTDPKRRTTSRLSRRSMLSGAAAAVAAPTLWLQRQPASHAAEVSDDPRFLIVLTASGGASIIDSALAIRASESATPDTLNTFEDPLVHDIPGSPFRAVDLDLRDLGPISVPIHTRQSDFVRAHHQDMMVATWTRTSVNHAIGQRRSVTGNEAWFGRTLQEMAAFTHGVGAPLPNVHLSRGSNYTSRGTDDGLPSWCFGETVSDPGLWPLALDGLRGLRHSPPRSLVDEARAMRNDRLDPASDFANVFANSRRLEHWKRIRGEPQRSIEQRGLIDQLLIFEDSDPYPISAHGLTPSPDAVALREVFPNLERDPLEAQAALAYLLIKNGVTTTVTLGPNFDFLSKEGLDIDFYGEAPPRDDDATEFAEGDIVNPPLGFDFSHQAHRSTQAFMWDRIYRAADGLIRLLRGQEWAGGQSLWDRTMIVVASDFGRSKQRPAGAAEFGTAHDLNNGILVLGPRVAGNRVLGGVDPDTGLTYGFDPASGAPDRNREMTEAEIFAGLLQALGVDTSEGGLPDMPAMRKGSA